MTSLAYALTNKYMPKVISDHTETLKFTWIKFPVHREIIVEYKLVFEVLSFHMLPAWVKHQKGNINLQALSLCQNICFMCRIFIGSKMPFFLMENVFFIFVDKFSVLEYLIHYVKFEMWAALFYVNYLPSFQQWNLN